MGSGPRETLLGLTARRSNLIVKVIPVVALTVLAARPCLPVDFTVDLPGRAPKGGQVIFLSEQEALVALNLGQRIPSPLMIVDIGSKSIKARDPSTLSMTQQVVARINDHRFAASTPIGILSCADEIKCSMLFNESGDISASPSGKWLVVRRQQSESRLDTQTGQVTATYPRFLFDGKMTLPFRIIPGDSDTLTDINGSFSILHADGTSTRLEKARGDPFGNCCSFVGPNLLVVLSTDPPAISGFNPQGRLLYRIPAPDPFHARMIAACCNGSRFALVEENYSLWNELVNPLDIMHNRPHDVLRLRIFEAVTGRVLSDTQWDPRVRPAPIALSPKGDLLAGLGANKVRIWSTPASR